MSTEIQTQLSIESLKKFAERHYLKNRVLVSKDIPGILDDIEDMTGIPLIRHVFRTGEDLGSWIVPPRWDVKEAWIKNSAGEVLASYDDHPLFVCPYSKAVHLTLSKEELAPHVFCEPRQPDSYAYNWRYASDYRRQLKDWGISLPQNMLDSLDEGPYEVLIDTEVEEGELLVGEMVLAGRSELSLMFLSNYCHPGQVNDSFSGLMMFMRLMHELAQNDDRHFTYRLLIMPETFGSAMYIAQDPSRIMNVRGAIFSEAVGWGDAWYIKSTLEGHSYLDLLSADCRRVFTNVQETPFLAEGTSSPQVYGNDELIFNSVQVGIPSLSVQKFPFAEYHTSQDDPSRLNHQDMQQAHDMIYHMVDVLERDAVYRFSVPVPFWMTRFDLYSDSIYDQNDYFFRFAIVYRYLDGQKSILQIAHILNVPFEKVYTFVKKMEECDLVEIVDLHPWGQIALQESFRER